MFWVIVATVFKWFLHSIAGEIKSQTPTHVCIFSSFPTHSWHVLIFDVAYNYYCYFYCRSCYKIFGDAVIPIQFDRNWYFTCINSIDMLYYIVVKNEWNKHQCILKWANWYYSNQYIFSFSRTRHIASCWGLYSITVQISSPPTFSSAHTQQ